MAHLAISDRRLPNPAALATALATAAPGAPIVVMIHGYRFAPDTPFHDPHRHILSPVPERGCWKAVSWPRHLGLMGRQGLAIGFGWQARGTIWQAHRGAARAGRRLARLIAALHATAPDRPLHIFAHSLGARVALTALDGLPAGAVGRIILLSAAAFRHEARAALATPAGARAEVINVRGRENTLFDLMLRLALPLHGPTLGAGFAAPNWLDLPLHDAHARDRLRALGYRIAAHRARVCHWSGYLRPGVWRFYRAALHHPAQTPLPLLRAQIYPAPAQISPRRGIGAFLPLPFGGHRPS